MRNRHFGNGGFAFFSLRCNKDAKLYIFVFGEDFGYKTGDDKKKLRR